MTRTKDPFWRVTANEYHADHSAVSHGMLETFRQSAALYEGRYVTHVLPPFQPTDEMILGSAVHYALLEPEKWTEEVAVAPRCDRRTTVGKVTWARFQTEAAGKLQLTMEQFESMRRMVDNARRNKLALALLDGTVEREVGVRWLDSGTGLECKCKPDGWSPKVLYDVKTARKPQPGEWRRQAASLGYHRQASWYAEGCAMLLGEPHDHYFIVIGNEPPHDAYVYRMNLEAMELGARQNHRDLERLAGCVKSGKWMDWWADAVMELHLPTWCFLEGD